MEYIEKKLTYLRGLCDGSGFSDETPEGKIFHGIIDLIDDMSFMLETYMEDDDLEEFIAVDEDNIPLNLEDSQEPLFFYSFVCPNCEYEIDVDEATIEVSSEIECPNCQSKIPLSDN